MSQAESFCLGQMALNPILNIHSPFWFSGFWWILAMRWKPARSRGLFDIRRFGYDERGGYTLYYATQPYALPCFAEIGSFLKAAYHYRCEAQAYIGGLCWLVCFVLRQNHAFLCYCTFGDYWWAGVFGAAGRISLRINKRSWQPIVINYYHV